MSAADGPSVVLAFAAGLLSVFSPCILPLIPSYLAFVGGTSLAELEAGAKRSGVLVRTLFFVLGFTIVFVALGVLFSGAGVVFSGASSAIYAVAGVVVVVLGLNMIFDFWKLLNVERRLHLAARPAATVGAIAVGMAFAAGWTPCVGPILAAILLLAGNTGSVARGIVYLTIYSLGLGIPFVAAGLFFRHLRTAIARLRAHASAISLTSGVLLIVIGLLIALGRLQRFNSAVVGLGSTIHRWATANAAAVPVLSLVCFAAGFSVFVPSIIRTVRVRAMPRVTAIFTAPRIAVSVFFVALGGLELGRIIDLGSVLYHWLTFQGI